jgi:hypothetical protein
MKKIKYFVGALCASVFLLSSCSESFFDINTDPSNPSQATPNLVLPSGISGSAFVMGGYYQALGSYWSQQYAQAPAATQWSEWESYNLTDDDLDRQFVSMYSGALLDLEYVRKSTASSANWAPYSIATLMQAYDYQVLADLYDSIPFREALKGSANLQPKYDDGRLVYDSLIVRINDAISKDFSVRTSVNPKTSDLVFGGDMNSWIAFGNTLKLKIYLRYVNDANPNRFKNEITALLDKNNFLDTDAKFVAFKAEETGYNPLFNTFVDRLAGNLSANKTIVDFLTTNTDPRLQKMFTAAATGGLYTGIATGNSKNLLGTIKNYATPTIGNLDPVYFFSKEEVKFLIAEAQARFKTPAEAQATFQDGIKASLVSLGLADNAVTYPYNGIKSILEQKWVAATNKRAIESFFDFNRTGYPDLFSVSLTSIFPGTDRPKRVFFPASERKSNINTPKRVDLTKSVWWGK